MRTSNPTSFILALLFILGGMSTSFASIYCPDDITLDCTMNYNDTSITGVATVVGYAAAARYNDETFLGSCRLGSVKRTWYADKNYNNILDETEVSCVQWITINDIYSTPSVNFPTDVTVTCVDDIPNTKPTYIGGPCDNFGVNVNDQVFNVADGVCRKILRTFTVINWCDYHPSDPNWDGSGIWEGTQKIKVIDNQAPKLMVEDDITVSVGSDCQASVSLSNYAIDSGNCPSGELSYELYIDLDWDGVAETRYSYLLDDDYYIAPAVNGASVSVDLVDPLSIGKYNIKWTVKDGCGNIRSETSKLHVKDLKPPTPYCISFLHATVNGEHGDDLRVTPKIFDRGSFDNCSWPSQIKLSFSEDVNDTLRIVNCDNSGIQFYRLYATDHFGNQDFCEVFLLAFDNGTCSFSFSPIGHVSFMDGTPFEQAEFHVMNEEGSVSSAVSDGFGEFMFENVELHENYTVQAMTVMDMTDQISTLDLIVLYRHLLGLENIANFKDHLAADINGDKRLSPSDLGMFRDILLGKIEAPTHFGQVQFVNSDVLEGSSTLETLQDFYNLYQYRGAYRFKAYVPGDLDYSHVSFFDPALENRIDENIPVRLVVENGKSQLEILQDISIDGIDLQLNKEAVVGSDVFDLQANSINSSAQETKLIHIKEISLEKGDVLFEIEEELDANEISGAVYTIGDKKISRFAIIEKDDVAEQDLFAYPNPVIGEINLSKASSYTLMNVNGQVVKSSSMNQARINVANLSPGVYLLELKDHLGNVSIEKIIKQ